MTGTQGFQKIVSVVPPGGSLFEIATPSGVWSPGRSPDPPLDVTFVACGVGSTEVQIENGMVLSGLGLFEDHVDTADMVIVPTWPIATQPVPDSLSAMLRSAHDSGTRVVGLCLGAFVLGAAGLLEHKSAVTHWRYRDRFESLFPSVVFEPDTLYVDHDSVVTSAGSAAAVDCCLHLVRRDHGAEVAASIARSMVTAPHRSGTQSQFASAPPIVTGDDPLSHALATAAADIAAVNSVADLAALAQTSRRSIERQLQARLGVSPKAWIDEQRVIAACRLLETTSDSIEQVAAAAGYGSTPTMRRAFQEARSTTPTAYRSMFSD